MSEQEHKRLVPKAVTSGAFLKQISNVTRNALPEGISGGLTLEEGLGYWARRHMTPEQFAAFRGEITAAKLAEAFRGGRENISFAFDDPEDPERTHRLQLHLFAEEETGEVQCVGSIKSTEKAPSPVPAAEPSEYALSEATSAAVRGALEDLQIEMEMERKDTRKKHRRTVFLTALLMAVAGILGGAALDQKVEDFSRLVGQLWPAASESPQPTATPEPAPVAAEVPDPVTEYIPFTQEATFTAEVMENGTARMNTASETYHTLTVTARVVEVLGPAEFEKLYARQGISLDGTEHAVHLSLSFAAEDGTESLIPQEAFSIRVTTLDGEELQGYQLMDAPLGGQYNVTLSAGTAAELYKRYEATGEAQYLRLTCYAEGVQHNLCFALRYEDPNAVSAGLKAGDRGPEVLAMKGRLAALGYLSERAAAYNQYNQDTVKAVRAAQTAFGLEATGTADADFLKALYSAELPAAAQE